MPHPLIKGIYSIKVTIVPLPNPGLSGVAQYHNNSSAQRTTGTYIYIIALGRHTRHTAAHTHYIIVAAHTPAALQMLWGFGGLCIVAIMSL